MMKIDARRSSMWAVLAVLAIGTTLIQPLHAQEPPLGEIRTIRVSGTGEVRVQPDLALIDLTVETFAPTAREAGEQNARQMEGVVQALVAAGIPRADIQTRGYVLFPEYTAPPREPQERPRIRGYRASNMITVRTESIERVGALIDTALAAGANRMDAIRFSLQDTEAAQSEALARAVQRARRSAETMASALGVGLGSVVDARTDVDVVRPFAQDMARMAMEAGPPTPIQPGEQTVTASVSLVFAIEAPR